MSSLWTSPHFKGTDSYRVPRVRDKQLRYGYILLRHLRLRTAAVANRLMCQISNIQLYRSQYRGDPMYGCILTTKDRQLNRSPAEIGCLIIRGLCTAWQANFDNFNHYSLIARSRLESSRLKFLVHHCLSSSSRRTFVASCKIATMA